MSETTRTNSLLPNSDGHPGSDLGNLRPALVSDFERTCLVGPSEMADPMSVGFKLNPWRPARTDTNGGGNCEAIRRLTTRAATLIVACVDATVLIIVASYVMLVAYYVAGRGERAWLLGYCGIVMVLLLLNGQYRRRITLTAARDVGPLFLCLAGGVLILEVIPGGRMAAAECLQSRRSPWCQSGCSDV